MRSRWACRITALMLGLTLAAPRPASTSERIVIDGSTGVMPLVAALAKAYQERHPAAVVEMGKGLGTKARLRRKDRHCLGQPRLGWRGAEPARPGGA